MSEFIRLTSSNGTSFILPIRRIHLAMQFQGIKYPSFVETHVYTAEDSYHSCIETPEQIMALLEGATVPVPASPVKASGVHLLNHYEVSREGANKGFVNYIRCSCEMEFLTNMQKHISAKEQFNAHLMAMACVEASE